MSVFFFPDSFIGQDPGRFVSGLLGTLTLVSPAEVDAPSSAKNQETQGMVRQVVPAWKPGELEAFLAFLTNARAWGAAHQGTNGRAVAAASGRSMEDSLHALRDAVVSGGSKGQAEARYPLMPDRVLAHLSRRLSADQYEAAAGMAEVRTRERAMFRALSGLVSEDRRSFVPPQRGGANPQALLRAWAALFLALDEPVRVFVTCDPDCLASLEEGAPGAARLFSAVRLPVFAGDEKAFEARSEAFREALRKVLDGGGRDAAKEAEEAIAKLGSEEGGPAAEITAVFFPFLSGADLFSHIAGPHRDGGGRGSGSGSLALCVRFIP
ncbi:MAG: hypothetical protein AB1921_13455 [Thermodesulfobacteriota bacterium]